MRSLVGRTRVARSIDPHVATDNTAIEGSAVDGLRAGSVMHVLCTGAIADTDAEFAVKLQHRDEGGNWEDAPSKEVDDPTPASFSFNDDNVARHIAYIGGKRYSRLHITPSGNSGNAPIAAVAVLGHLAE